MNLKKLLAGSLIVFFSASTLPAISDPVTTSMEVPNTPAKGNDADVQSLLQRLHEIKDMDKSNLSKEEKRDLRKEVKDIKKEMKAKSKGIYISVGAAIIIIILLILLL